MKKLYLFLFFAFSVLSVNAQKDSLIFKNGSYMVGEIKKMDWGVIIVKTNYSDSDFKIEWDGVTEIYTETYFLITLSNGSRYNGYLRSSGDKITVVTSEGREIIVNYVEIVFLDEVDNGFWSQLYFSFDIGLDLAKANNFSKFSGQSTLGYVAKRWRMDATYDLLSSVQDNTEDIRRTDGGVGFKYFLPRDWYPSVSVNFLANTEQKINLRVTSRVGMGKYAIHTNKTYWGFSLGVNNNNENFSDDTPGRNSWEGFFGTELNMFDIGALNLLTKIFAYPSFTETGRWRADFSFDAKYEMPFDDDFYIKLGLSFNYDNRPVEGAAELDYVFHTGFGWEW
jgi:hypothetical protein